MPVAPAATELLRALAPVASRWGGWYLFGAQAVIAHGVPRLSADVDVTLNMRPEDPVAFTHDMQRAGFDSAVPDPEFVRRTRVLPFVHRPTAMPLDVVLASSGLEEEFLARATPMDVGGTTVPVIDVEDLIIAKVLAARDKEASSGCSRTRLGRAISSAHSTGCHTGPADHARIIVRMRAWPRTWTRSSARWTRRSRSRGRSASR